jgi:hypothetical protein
MASITRDCTIAGCPKAGQRVQGKQRLLGSEVSLHILSYPGEQILVPVQEVSAPTYLIILFSAMHKTKTVTEL